MTGQTVVETAIVLVTRTKLCDSAGQSVTVAAQEVIVSTVVVYTVDVVNLTGEVVAGGGFSVELHCLDSVDEAEAVDFSVDDAG